MTRPRRLTIHNVIGLKYRPDENRVYSPNSAIRDGQRSVSLSELIRLRDWLNNTIQYIEEKSEDLAIDQFLKESDPMTLEQSLETEHRDEILDVITMESSRMNYRRDALKSLFVELDLDVKFSIADMRSILKSREKLFNSDGWKGKR